MGEDDRILLVFYYMPTLHTPVLLNEVLEYLNPCPGQNFIDATFGAGGHGLEILKKIKLSGKLLAIDANADVSVFVKNKDNKNLIFINDNFRNLDKIVKKNFPYHVKGILLDLGLSSDELEQSGRGFSFLKNEPLDMRFSVNQELTAAEIINHYSLGNLIDIFKKFGEYKHAGKLAEKIIELRKKQKFQTTFDLVRAINLVHHHNFKEKIHPATKVFQALRIAVNEEFKNLTIVLPQAIDILAPGGRLAIISFHALEDRIVKNFFRDLSRAKNPEIKILTKKPVVPINFEVHENPRSRSAKLRVIEKI